MQIAQETLTLWLIITKIISNEKKKLYRVYIYNLKDLITEYEWTRIQKSSGTFNQFTVFSSFHTFSKIKNNLKHDLSLI